LRYTPEVTKTTKNARPTPRNLFSFSRLKTLDQCPFRYRLRYLKGMKEAFKSVEIFLGNTVHSTLEWMYGERHNGTSPSLDESVEWFSTRWHEDWSADFAVVRLSDAANDYHLLGREMVNRFHREVFQNDRSATVSLEQRMTVKLTPRVVFSGFADRIGRTQNGKLFVVDYKTSKSVGNPSEFSEGLQSPLYAACALDHHDEEQALAGYHYLRAGETRWQDVSRDRGRQLFGRFVELAEQALNTTEFPAQPGILCAWCGYNAVCESAEVSEALSGGLKLAEERNALQLDGLDHVSNSV
jgi:ATP-dependent helicase/DNAse subunit B